MTVQLDAEQIDALSEIFNIGVGKAAAAMGALMHDEVLLSVPHVSIFTVSEAAQQLGAAGSTMYGVRQPFRGTFNGDALLIFPGHKSLEIVRIVAGQSMPGEDLSAIEQDAMTEVGNVMLNACIAALSDLLGNEFQLSPPASTWATAAPSWAPASRTTWWSSCTSASSCSPARSRGLWCLCSTPRHWKGCVRR